MVLLFNTTMDRRILHPKETYVRFRVIMMSKAGAAVSTSNSSERFVPNVFCIVFEFFTFVVFVGILCLVYDVCLM